MAPNVLFVRLRQQHAGLQAEFRVSLVRQWIGQSLKQSHSGGGFILYSPSPALSPRMIPKQRFLIRSIDYCSAAKGSQKAERYRNRDRGESNFVSLQEPSSLHREQLGEIKSV